MIEFSVSKTSFLFRYLNHLLPSKNASQLGSKRMIYSSSCILFAAINTDQKRLNVNFNTVY